MQTPGAMCTCRGCTISQQNRVVRTSAFGCLNWAGSISFVRTFLRGYLWASPPFFFFFFFLSTLGIELKFFFFCFFFTKTYTREIWRASRAEFLFTRQVSLGNRYCGFHGRACMCVCTRWFGSALCTIYCPSCWNISRACPLYHLLSVVLKHAWLSPAPRQVCPESKTCGV